jgi:Zn-finger nucleic acid-binding protein
MGETPFRERPRVLLCPRCGEVLERISDGVHACMRCEGAWLGVSTIGRAFSDPHWPGGASAWWRRALPCPACAHESGPSDMTPTIVAELIIDRCATHGVWLDHGELGRLLGTSKIVELEALYERLRPGGELPPALVAQRKRRTAEAERRQREIEAYRAQLAAEHARLDAEKRAAEFARLEQLRAEQLDRLEKQRADAQRQADDQEKELVALRERVHVAEDKLAETRGRLLELQRLIEVVSAR